jgi:DNA-binding MarR family transcriptional regulator
VNTEITDTEYIILENLYAKEGEAPTLKQRDLAQLARTSLGMINSILKRMVQKGWITARKLNSRNIHYAITLDGINEVIHRSYSYFKRTIKNIAYYKDAINEIIQSASEKNIKTVLLLGTSDLDFIIEHSCSFYGLSFLKSADRFFYSENIDDSTLVIFAEDIPFSNESENENYFYISQLLINIKGKV